MLGALFRQGVLGQRGEPDKIDCQRDQHAHACCTETVVPAYFLTQRAAHEWSDERTDIHADIEYRIGAVAAVIAGRIQRAHLGPWCWV
jgi:hypothetical protein